MAGSTRRTSSRTPTIGRSSSGGRGSRRRDGRRWVAFEDSREAVRFEIREGLDSIGVDAAALDAGLVVVPRESVGTAGDVADRAPATLARETPVRARIEQVSSVEHAVVLGVPVAGQPGTDGLPRLTAGLGRPLILTTLEPAEAMRIIAGGSARPRLVAACFIVGAALLAAGLAWAGLGAIMTARGARGPCGIAVARACRRPAQQRRGTRPGRPARARAARGRRNCGSRDRHHEGLRSPDGPAVGSPQPPSVGAGHASPHWTLPSRTLGRTLRFRRGAASPNLRTPGMTFVLLARTVRLVGCRRQLDISSSSERCQPPFRPVRSTRPCP